MSNDKVILQVVCNNSSGASGNITIGKRYDVVEDYGDGFTIIDDLNEKNGYVKQRFNGYDHLPSDHFRVKFD